MNKVEEFDYKQLREVAFLKLKQVLALRGEWYSEKLENNLS